MSTPRGADRSVEIALHGYVTLQDVCSHVGEIWRRARQQQGLLFAFDGSAVLDFSALALTAMSRLRIHLREFQCDLAIVKFEPSAGVRRDDPLLAPLLMAQPPEDEGEPAPPPNRLTAPGPMTKLHPAQAGLPAPHHIPWFVKGYQRYWLN